MSVPLSEFYSRALPAPVVEAVLGLQAPCFVYDAAVFRRDVSELVRAFPAYYFPVKANAEPALLAEAVSAGAGLDLCSDGDLALAEEAGCPYGRMSFTAAVLHDRLLERLHRHGCEADVDGVEDALRWLALGPRPCGVRVNHSASELYGAKFGIPVEDLDTVAASMREAGGTLAGVHVHEGHKAASPEQTAAHLDAILDLVPDTVLGGLSYVNLGGGWQAGQTASQRRPVEEYARALGRLEVRLRERGFGGETRVEPGEYAAIGCGWWAARVAAVKRQGRNPDGRIVVLDTNTPMSPRATTPMAVLRTGDAGASVVDEEPAGPCDIFGSANNERDRLASRVPLPALGRGDLVVVTRVGAYQRSLMTSFNERPVPPAHVIDTDT